MDLMRVLSQQGHEVYIVSPSERRNGKKTHEIVEDRVHILKVRTLNIKRTNVIEKGLATLLLESQYLHAINKYWKDKKFDLILYSTPPITFNKVITTLRKRTGAPTYLLLKDIFPQNAVDLEMFKKGSFIYKLFRNKEKRLYEISDKIGCMSDANMKYLLDHNKCVSKEKVEVFPNCIEPLPLKKATEEDRRNILKKLDIPTDKTISLFGGNLGKPQGIGFLLKAIAGNENRENSFILVVGSGTEYKYVKNWFDFNQPRNAKLLSALPKEDYDVLKTIADIGLIFLDHRFTIPNFPSRILSYLESGVPVLIASDPVSDMGPIAEKEGFGLWCESNDIESFNKNLNNLVNNKTLRIEMGMKGRTFLEDNYVIKNHLEKLFNV